MVNVYYSPAYAGSAHAFDTTRKAQWVADSLTDSPIPGITLIEPMPLTAAQVVEVHDPEYVRAVETGAPRGLAQSQGFAWDPGLWPMVLASNGGAAAAALDALENGVAGSLSSGLHHARKRSGAGFCTFNGLVIAARTALRSGAGAVLILDFDAHCGGGTASLIGDDANIWQADISVNGYDEYASADRTSLEIVDQASDYLPATARRLDWVNHQGIHFGLCLYNAGVDPHEDCATGGFAGITSDMLATRER